MDPKLLAMLATAGHMMFADEPGGEGGSAAPTVPAPAPTDGEQPQGDPAELGDAGKRAIAAERKRADEAVKAHKALEAQMQAKADESLTETQRLQKQVNELSSKYEEERRAGLRKDAVSKAELPAFLAAQIEGDSYESMLGSAEALKAAFDAEVTARTKPGTPAPDPSQGAHQPLDPTMHSRPGVHRLAAAFEQQLESNS